MAVEKLPADWVGVVPNYTMGLWRSRQCFFVKKRSVEIMGLVGISRKKTLKSAKLIVLHET